MKRGRPKGRSSDTRSFGPLGDLIRTHRLGKRLGLLDVAKACGCSVQFVSNIEHGRAPLPWEKVEVLANFLKIPVEEVQAANLAVRSDFKSFVGSPKSKRSKGASVSAANSVNGAAQAVAFTARDAQLRELISRYYLAPAAVRSKFIKTAMRVLPRD